MITELQIRRDEIGATRLAGRDAEPAEGQASFVVEHFALTANNVTYAAHGVDLHYWDFYPAPEDWGIVPVWGFGRVARSRVEGLAEGDRFYGYWPMADGALLTPVKATPKSFVDGAPHRAPLPKVYNGFAAVTEAMGDERVYALFRPLFLTSFLLDAQLAGSAATLLIASASSKTALGLAHAARARGGVQVVGLTSPGNRAFVEATGYYDRVATYAEVASLAVEGTVAYADFSGDAVLRQAVHTRFGAALALSLMIGDTHWDAEEAGGDLPGIKPDWFFAPAVLATQIGAVGQAAFDAGVESAWQSFTASTSGWLRIVEVEGGDAAAAAWTRLAGGDVDPAVGLIVSI